MIPRNVKTQLIYKQMTELDYFSDKKSPCEIFYDTFTTKRNNICELLKKNCEYTYLTWMFNELESVYPNSVKNLLLGLSGYECNKNMALYTLPTIDFMHIIFALQIILDKFNIVELYAGLGLFSGLYASYIKNKNTSTNTNNETDEDDKDEQTKIATFDAGRCLETHTNILYSNVKKMSLESFIIKNTSLEQSICVALMPTNIDKHIQLFLSVCQPNCFVIIIDEVDKDKLINSVTNEDYHLLFLKTNVISYLDYYENNKKYPRTCICVISHEVITEDMINLLVVESMMFNRGENKIESNEIEKIIIDGNKKHIFPNWICELNINEKNDVIKKIYNLQSSQTEITNDLFEFIYNNINDMNELDEYINWKPIQPIKCTKKQFIEYRNIYRQLITNNNLSELKYVGILPKWIDELKEAIIYIFLEYEIDRYDWKINKENFNTYVQRFEQYFNF